MYYFLDELKKQKNIQFETEFKIEMWFYSAELYKNKTNISGEWTVLWDGFSGAQKNDKQDATKSLSDWKITQLFVLLIISQNIVLY